MKGGSYGYASIGGRVALAGTTNHSISGSYTRSDGYSRNKAGGLNADYSGSKAFYQGHYADKLFAVDWHAGLSSRGFGSNTFYGAKWDDQYEHTLKTYTAVTAENRQGRVHLKPAIYWNRTMDRFELFRDAPDIYPFNYHRTDVYGVNLNGHFDWLLELREACHYDEALLKEMADDGLLTLDGDNIVVNSEGRPFVRCVAAALDPLMQHTDKSFSNPI